MHVIMVHIKVKPEHLVDFQRELHAHVANTKATEPGCVQFDVSIDKSDPSQLYIYEVYRDDQAMADHLKSVSLKRMGEVTPPWVAGRKRFDAVPWDDRPV